MNNTHQRRWGKVSSPLPPQPSPMPLPDAPLPPGWVWTTIGAVRIDIGKSLDPRAYPNEMFELYSVPGHAEGQAQLVFGRDIGSNKQIVQPEAVLLCKINPHINRVWVVGELSSHRKIASTEWIPFFPVKGIAPKYLAYFMQNEDFRSFLALNVSGVGGSLMRIRPSSVDSYPLPLPPLLEQGRIVAAIETYFTRLDAGVAALKRIQTGLRRYKASVLKAACEGRLVPTEAELARHVDSATVSTSAPYESGEALLRRILAERRRAWEAAHPGKHYEAPPGPDTRDLPELPEGWVWATVEQVGDVAEQTVLTGPFGVNLGRQDFTDTGVPVLTIGCLTEQGIDLEKAMHITEEKALELDRYKVREGDLLFSRMATVGRAGYVTKKSEGSIVNYHLMRLRLAEHIVHPAYFINYIRGSNTVTEYVRDVNHGATRDGINTTQLLELPVSLPPLSEQHRIVAEVERRLSVVAEVEASVAANLRRAARLRQAILRQAFAGKLVPQDPNDEPASALLARIRAERAPGRGRPAPTTQKGRPPKTRQLPLL